jgi:predicted small secreted protein
MRDELEIETLRRAKAGAAEIYEVDEADKDFWLQVNADCDAELIAISKEVPKKARSRIKLIIYAVTIAVLIYLCVGCNAVSGLGRDVTWFGEAGQEMLEHGHESIKE